MNRRNSVRTWAARLAVVAGALGTVALGLREGTEPATDQAAQRDAWTRGETRTYRVDLTTRDQALLPVQSSGSDLSADAAFEGTVAVTYRGPVSGNRLFGWRIEHVESLTASLGEQEFEIPGPAVTGFELLVETDARGAVQTLHVDEQAPEVARNLLRTIATESQLPSFDGHRWSGTERASHGTVAAEYVRNGDIVDKLREDYSTFSSLAWLSDVSELAQDVDSEFRFTVDDAGRMTRAEGGEELRVTDDSGALLLASDLTLSMSLVEAQRPARAPKNEDYAALLAQRRAYAADTAIASAEAEHNALQARAGGMTLVQLEGWIGAFSGTPSDDPTFAQTLWSATGLLEANPELCAALAESFDGPDRNEAQRLLTLDVLASTGHDAAQRSMIRALSSEAARRDTSSFARYLQRAAMVEKPLPELTAFVTAELDGATSDHGRLASAYTLASLAKRSREAGDPAAAEAATHRVAAELAGADEPDEQSHLLRALSNTSSPANVEIARAYVTSDSWAVRAAAAESLHEVNTAEARELLTGMLADTHPLVQGSALRQLTEFPAASFDVEGVRDFVFEASIDEPAYHHLVAYAQKAPTGSARDDILRYILEHSPDNPGMRDRAAAALRAGRYAQR